jgi:two-component system, sporulation sensor kinase A
MEKTLKEYMSNKKDAKACISEDAILSAIVEGSTDGIIQMDIEGRIISWTKGAEHLLGYKREEIIGKSVDLVIPPESREDVHQAMRNQVKGDVGVVHTETCRLNSDGQNVNVQLTRIPLKNSNGITVAFLVIFKDISENRKLQKEKKQLKSEHKQLVKKVEKLERNNAMARVAAKVAHEIRTPLGVLFLKSDLLLERLDRTFEEWGKGDPERHRQSLDKCSSDIQRQISRLEEIANNYLHLSKSRTMERQDIGIKHFLDDLVVELKEQYSSDGFSIKASINDDIGSAYFDPQQFHRVFANLVKNSQEAIQFSPIEYGQIELKAQRVENHIEFCIIDNGPGMPDDIKETVFDPFTTTKSIGTGLGLYLACEIVENHKGAISIESESGKGTSIHIVIPIEDKLD